MVSTRAQGQWQEGGQGRGHASLERRRKWARAHTHPREGSREQAVGLHKPGEVTEGACTHVPTLGRQQVREVMGCGRPCCERWWDGWVSPALGNGFGNARWTGVSWEPAIMSYCLCVSIVLVP